MSTEIWGRCPACDHTWRAAQMPQRLCALVTDLRAHGKCPQCGTPGMVAPGEISRVCAILDRIEDVRALAQFDGRLNAEGLAERLTDARAVVIDDSWQEFKADAALARTESIETIDRLLVEQRRRVPMQKYEAADDLLAAGVPREKVRAIIDAIRDGHVRHVTLNY